MGLGGKKQLGHFAVACKAVLSGALFFFTATACSKIEIPDNLNSLDFAGISAAMINASDGSVKLTWTPMTETGLMITIRQQAIPMTTVRFLTAMNLIKAAIRTGGFLPLTRPVF